MPQITTRLSPGIRSRFERYAAKLGLDASELARLLILREIRVRRLRRNHPLHPGRRVARKGGVERKLTAHFHLADNVNEFGRYANAKGFSRAAAARLIAERELDEKWLAKALVGTPSLPCRGQVYAACFAPHEALAARLLKSLPEAGGSHDVSHLIRVWKSASKIRAKEGGDENILAASVLLHDCLTIEKTSPRRSEASRLAAEKASQILGELDWTQEHIHRVKHCIEAHSFSAGIKPKTIEAKILQDADRLDAIGMIGVARCFYVAGELKERLYNLMDPQAAKGRNLDDKHYALDHFRTKLLTLASGFQTATGRGMARVRHERLQRFFEQFLDEI
jgi:uncharacterized protein